VAASEAVLKDFDFVSTLGRRRKDPSADSSGMCLDCGKVHCVCHDEDDKLRLF
jgi:hypothetical protein